MFASEQAVVFCLAGRGYGPQRCLLQGKGSS